MLRGGGRRRNNAPTFAFGSAGPRATGASRYGRNGYRTGSSPDTRGRLNLSDGWRRPGTPRQRLNGAGFVVRIAVDEGDEVRAGKVIAELDKSQLLVRRRQLTAQRRALEAQRGFAQATLKRQSRLKTRGWSPDQRFDEAQSDFARLTAEIDRVTAQIAGVDIDIQKSELKAPFDGTVAARSVDEGAVVAAGAPVVEVLETGRRRARIGLPPSVAAALRPGSGFEVLVGGQKLTAKLISRRPDLANGTRTVTLLFEIDDDSKTTPLGELVTINLETTVSERGAWVPLSALKEGRRGLWTILVVDQSSDSRIVRPEAVELLYARADQGYIRGTFEDGAQVISRGTGRVVAGQRVALMKDVKE